MTPDELSRLAVAHDHQTASEPLQVWIGAEPTFTDRRSEAPEWLSEALGAEKEARARQLVAALRERHPGAVVLRTIGRQYAGEPGPRWSYGLYERRDAEPIWEGPEDCLLDPPPFSWPAPGVLERLRDELVRRLSARGWLAAPVAGARERLAPLAFRTDGALPEVDVAREPRLLRPSIHSAPIPSAGLRDELAASGTFLLVLRADDPATGSQRQPCVELPALAAVDDFVVLLRLLGDAARAASAPALAFYGYPPPVDGTVLCCTFTPDPAVLEVNQPPAPDLQTFLRWNRELFSLAQRVGLAPLRLHYNGLVTDSGGGGQLTFGGPCPEQSPFFVAPQLLPRLVRYVLRHPALSYWFATQYIGSGSQSPRADEGLPLQLQELAVALEQLGRAPKPSPSLLWETLRHFLADYSGNPHRSELNIEKLYNAFLPGRGCLGLVEFRALRMPPSAERLTAIALLLRALVVALARRDLVPELVEWGSVLHDRFALPTLLRDDLREVFADLSRAGLGLGALEQVLLSGDERVLGALELDDGCRLIVEQACEFWPLVGDVISQESGGSRIVDASTSRFEVRLEGEGDALGLEPWEVLANGFRLPLVRLDEPERARLLGVRFRSFVPRRGLHPTVAAHSRLDLHLSRRGRERAFRVSLFTWRPDGSPYPGLPEDLEDARRRRAERFVVERLPPEKVPPARVAPDAALTPYCLDLRRT